MNSPTDTDAAATDSTEVDLVVIGLGYVGLPLAHEAALSGLRVAGFDVTPAVVDGLNGGRSHVDDLSDQDVADMVARGFVATLDESILDRATTAVICVPTPLSPEGGPDLGAVNSATAAIGRHLKAGQLIVLESTTYPGTTTDVIRPALEEASGLVAGTDFALAFSPERIDPGNKVYTLRTTPKIVGGLTESCTKRAAAFYGQVVDTVVEAAGPTEAETAKLLENTYRHINIALVNEMARFCHDLGIDLWDVINAAATKPFGFQAFRPGPGVGGHCIPIDPNYLSHNVRARLGYPFRFVELAEEINATMPAYVAQRMQNVLNEVGKPMKGSKVVLLGITYKPDIADQRESPAVPLAKRLHELGADLGYHDPHVAEWTPGVPVTRVELDQLGDADLVVLVQQHTAYDVQALVEASDLFFDTRGATIRGTAHRL